MGDDGQIGIWIARMDDFTQYSSVLDRRPCLWAVTDGGQWPINQYGTNDMEGGMQQAVPRWASRINARFGH